MVSCLLASLMKIRLNPPDSSEISHLFLNRRWSFFYSVLLCNFYDYICCIPRFEVIGLLVSEKNFIGFLSHLSRSIYRQGERIILFSVPIG